MRKLSESVWGDIRRRAEGTSVREEDELEDLYKKLCNTFIQPDEDPIEMYTDGISVPLFKYDYCYCTLEIRGSVKTRTTRMSMKYWEMYYYDFIQLLKKMYDIEIEENDNPKNWVYVNIKPKYGEKMDNDYIIELIDTLIENVKIGPKKRKDYALVKITSRKNDVNESVWGDVRRRAEGRQERKEDNVNNLDGQGFLNYLEKHYQTRKSPYNPNKPLWNMFIDINNVITIPIIFMGRSVSGKDNYNCFIRYYTYDNTVTIGYNIKDISEKLFNLLNDRYIVSSDMDNTRMTICYIIKPKDGGESSNSFLLEVLDFILDNMPQNAKQLIMKKENVNESVWGDIRRRAEGQSVREEDNIEKLDRDGLFEHIFDLYKPVNLHPLSLKSQTSQENTYFSIPIFKSNYTVYRLDVSFYFDVIDKITLMARDADIIDFKQPLIDNFDVTIRDDQALKIEDKNGNVSNKVCMDLIKVIVENAPQPLLKKRD